MDRRNFIATLMAGGVLGANPMASQAASQILTSTANAQPVLVVSQSGLPHAAALVARLHELFAAAAVPSLQAQATAGDLMDFSSVSALLGRMPGSRVIGVMDDACATIFAEIAASRGATCVLSTHHRLIGGEVRHCCTSAASDEGLVWSDPLVAHAERVGRLYAGTIGGLPAPQHSVLAAAGDPADAAGDARASLVSFLINI